MTGAPKETLANFRKRVADMEKPTRTSPAFKWSGIVVLLLALFCLLQGMLNPVIPRWMTWSYIGLGLILLIVGGILLAVKFMSDHSEDVEGQERKEKISERSGRTRCVYLEGNVPDGRGVVGRCRLYEFDMVEHPYCLYCHEYHPRTGSPDV